MKLTSCLLLIIKCLAIVTESHHVCGLVPPQILEHIRDSPLQDFETQQAANRTLIHLQEIQARRNQISDGAGIVASGDDKIIPNEDTAAGKAKEADEEKALLKADTAPADSGSVETTKRADTNAERYIYNDNRHCVQNPQPPVPVRKPGSAVATDPNVNKVYEDFGTIYDFFKKEFGRNSIDNAGSRLHGTVHFCSRYNNALWDGVQMLFGDGDGVNFKNFVNFIDVIGHEITHGIIQHSSPLRYRGQSGALNEHIADVFGSLVKQFTLKQTANEADWLIGAGLISGQRALRDMAEPGTAYNTRSLGKDPQPDNYKNLYQGNDDQGGVHINSGIPNRAFFLSASTIGGFAWEVPGQIWYKVLTSKQLSFDAKISSFAKLTIQFATNLYNDTIAGQVQDAWETVGVPLD